MGQNRGKWRRNGGTKAARDWDIQQRKERGMWACFPNVIKCRKPGRLNADPRAPALTINPLLTVCVCGFGRYVTEHSQRSNIAISNLSTPLPCLQYISHCFSPIPIRSILTCFFHHPQIVGFTFTNWSQLIGKELGVLPVTIYFIDVCVIQLQRMVMQRERGKKSALCMWWQVFPHQQILKSFMETTRCVQTCLLHGNNILIGSLLLLLQQHCTRV